MWWCVLWPPDLKQFMEEKEMAEQESERERESKEKEFLNMIETG